jgi:chromatin-remodeling ATPase INO80
VFLRLLKRLFAAAELEGDGKALPVPAGIQTFDGEDHAALHEINFDNGEYFDHGHCRLHSDDICRGPYNLHRHARQNAQEAIALAKQRAEQFDAQAALERKANEALTIAKHIDCMF